MAEQSGEKSQEPTQHRREQAREEGQVFKSQDMASAVLLILGTVTLMMAGGSLVEFFQSLATRELGPTVRLTLEPSDVTAECWAIVTQAARALMPIVGMLLLGAIVVDLAQIGFLFLPDKVFPDLTRLDPLAGLKRIFSLANVVRLAMGLFKVLIVGTVAGIAIYQERQTIVGLTGQSLSQIGQYLVQTLLWTSLKVAIALVILAIFDYAFQWWKHEQDLRMTPQEVREEMRNLEGDPQVASRRRAVQRELAAHRLKEAVPKADVVITNPTHLAVAIQYDPDTMHAPIVVAKGAGTAAERIRRMATQHNIPIVERKPLAQALYREVEINRPIPQDRYAAVAEVLAYVYQLKGKRIPGSTAA
jgi:flagellar biosynthetic protein FlhB